MTEPEFWDDPQSTGLFTNDFNSPVINFANLNVLTDYFVQDTLRAPGGNVRHIILTEQGFTSYSPTRGNIPEIQAQPTPIPITWWTAIRTLMPTRSAVR